MALIKEMASRVGTHSGGPLFKEIPLGDIRIKDNVRSEYTGIEELAESIRQYGLQQPISVYRDGEEYAVKTGHRRFKAYELLNAQEPDRFHSIRCFVSDGKDVAIIQLIENVQRLDLSAIDLYNALSMLKEKGFTPAQIAKVMGKVEKYVKYLFFGIKEIAADSDLKNAMSYAGITIQDVIETKGVPKEKRLELLEQRRLGELPRVALRGSVRELKEIRGASLSGDSSAVVPQKVEVRVTVDVGLKTITLFSEGIVDGANFADLAEDIKRYLAKSKKYKIGTNCPADAGQ